MSMLGLGVAGGRRGKTRRGGGYYGKGGIDPMVFPMSGGGPGYGPVNGNWHSGAQLVSPNAGAVTRGTLGGARRTLKAKTLRRMLKKKGMKTTGKKSTLMKRLKMKGGRFVPVETNAEGFSGGTDRHGYDGTGYHGDLTRA